MKKADLAAFADRRRWEAMEEASSAHWLARKRELGPIGGLQDAAALWEAARAVRPDWPSAADRAADLEMHTRLSEGLRSVSRSPTGSKLLSTVPLEPQDPETS